MERLTNKDLTPVLKYEKLINNIYKSYKPIESYIEQKTIKSYKDLNLNSSELRKSFNFRKLYDNNIKLFEFINTFNLRMFDYFDTYVQEEVKKKYGETVYDILRKALHSWVDIHRLISVAVNSYKDYFSVTYDGTTGKFLLDNLPNGAQVDISKYCFNSTGTLKEPDEIYRELKRDYNLVEFDLNSLKETYKEIVSTVLENYEKEVKVLSNVEICQTPVDKSHDYLTHQYSSFKEEIKIGEEIHLLLGSEKVVIPLPGEFSDIDAFNYYKVASNYDLVQDIFANEETIYEGYDINQEIINSYLSDDGEYHIIKLKVPMEYTFGENKVELSTLMYYTNSNIEIKPLCETSPDMVLSDFN